MEYLSKYLDISVPASEFSEHPGSPRQSLFWSSSLERSSTPAVLFTEGDIIKMRSLYISVMFLLCQRNVVKTQ